MRLISTTVFPLWQAGNKLKIEELEKLEPQVEKL